MHTVKVKISFPFPNGDLSRQLPLHDETLSNYSFHINPESEDELYDYWVVYENIAKPTERTRLKNAANTIFITGEPPTVKTYTRSFLSQFHLVISSHRDIRHPNLLLQQQALPWTVKKNHASLRDIQQIPKQKFMSIITSNKTITEGHRKRLDFARKLKALYPDNIDLYGRGINDFGDKWEVLSPYKYHLCIENSSFDNYFTEKLIDAYLCFTFPLYYGCPNLGEYFSSQSYMNIDIDDITGTSVKIERLLHDETHYEKSLAYLKAARQECLERYNLFPYLREIIETKFDLGTPGKAQGAVSKKIIQAPTDIAKYYVKKWILRRL